MTELVIFVFGLEKDSCIDVDEKTKYGLFNRRRRVSLLRNNSFIKDICKLFFQG